MMFPLRALHLVLGILLLTNCNQAHRDFDQILESGQLRVLTINSETTYYVDRDGKKSGFEFELVKHFASSHGLKVHLIVKDSVEDLIESLIRGQGDLVAAGLSITDEREKNLVFSPSYFEIQQQVICQRGIRPKAIEDLQKLDLIVGAGSSYVERLENLKSQYKGLAWRVLPGKNTPEVIQSIHLGEADCTVADSNFIKIYRRFFPDLHVAFNLGSPEELAWAMLPGQKKLIAKVNKWFESEGKTQVSLVRNTHYGYVEDFDPFDIKKFTQRMKERLPKYEPLLRKAAKAIGWDWTLLAAVAYQESHWNPTAKSPTGVRGFMMLTQNTAKELGVKNRLDTEESIMGGARYLKKLEARIPNYIPYPDRRWLALAAYNVGFSHLRDARGLAAWRNQNPNSWLGVREVLPLLASRKHYKRLPSGYARGLEPVIYVDRIRNYESILKRKYKK